LEENSKFEIRTERSEIDRPFSILEDGQIRKGGTVDDAGWQSMFVRIIKSARLGAPNCLVSNF